MCPLALAPQLKRDPLGGGRPPRYDRVHYRFGDWTVGRRLDSSRLEEALGLYRTSSCNRRGPRYHGGRLDILYPLACSGLVSRTRCQLGNLRLPGPLHGHPARCPFPRASVWPPSNKRLKLAGGDRSKGSGVLCAGAHELSFNDTVPCGWVARSLSANR